MKFKASKIAEILNGSIHGNPDVEVDKLSKIEEAQIGSLTFLANPKYTSHIYKTKASVCIVSDEFEPIHVVSTTLIKVPDPYEAFSQLLEFYNQVKLHKSGIENPSYIDETVKYGSELYVGAFAYIGKNVTIGNRVKIYPNTYIGDNVQIGDDVIVFAGSKIYSESILGNHVVIHGGAIIGADGFGFAPNEAGVYKKVPQIGNVIIEDHVDVGAGTTIDRATLGSTIIREGVKLDNHIQIAHNVEIGRHTVIAAQTGIAGSTKIGEHCVIGGQVGIVGHIQIGNYVKIQAQSGIGRNVKDHEVLQGTPAFGYSEYNKAYVHFKNLPEIVKKLDTLYTKFNNHE